MSKASSLLLAGLVLVAARSAAEDAIPTVQVAGHPAHATRILARFKSEVSATAPQAVSVLSSLGLAVQRSYPLVPGLVAIDEPAGRLSRQAVGVVDPEQQARVLVERIGALRSSGLFAYVEPNYIWRMYAEPNDERYVDGTLWGLRNDGNQGGVFGADISAKDAWDLTTGSTNVIVAVIDSGVRYTHQELRTQMWRNPVELAGQVGVDDDGNGLVDDIYGINANDPNQPTGDPMDFNDHGTHVSGTIGAAANDGTPHVGVNWNVQIMACKFLGGPDGTGPTEGAIACLQYAVTNKAKVLNNSWGGGAFSSALYDAIAVARSAGVLFVAAAGNAGTDNDIEPSYPANYDLDNIISVAALDRADDLADFSQYGLTTVDLGAPGVEIFSSISASDQAYDFFQGTSMAAPHVTGVAALVRAHYPGISLFELRERLMRTVIPIPSLDGRCVTGGRVNAYKALVAVGDGDMELAVTPAPGSILLEGSTVSVLATVTDMFGVTNAAVSGVWVAGGVGTVNFMNNGAAPDVQAGDATYSAAVVMPTGVSEATLRFVVTAPGKNSLTNLVTWLIAVPPENDDFEDAFKLPNVGGVVYSITDFATFQPQEPLHAGVPTVNNTLWWNWSPAASGPVLVDTSGSDFDSVLAVYTGSLLGNLTNVVAVNDVNNRRQAYAQFDAVQGVTYRIVVGGTSTNEHGGLRLRVEPNGIPDVLPPIIQFFSPGDGLITSSNRVVVSGTATDPRPGSGVSQVFVRINDDLISRTAAGTTNWSSSFLLRPGINRIFAQGMDFAFNESATVSLTVQYMPVAPPNDHFGNAAPLDPALTNVTVTTAQATREYLEPHHAGNEGGHSVWYRYQAPADGVLQLSTVSVTFDTLLAVYTGNRVTNLTAVASNDDFIAGNRASKVALGVRANTTYHIAIDGYAAGSGTCRLTYTFTPQSVRHLTLTAGEGGRVSPESGDYEGGSTVVLMATPDIGYEFVRWEFAGGATATVNPYSLVMDADYSVTARFRKPTITDDFETGGFKAGVPYVLNPAGSNKPWRVQNATAAGGTYAARSGVIGANQKSILTLTARLDAGVASFAYRVSSELNWDVFTFSVNGEVMQEWSGNVEDWGVYQFVVTSGTNTLEWRYSKDFAIELGEDAAYIDNLILPLSSGAGPLIQTHTAGQHLTLQFAGETGQSYTIETSADLIRWEPVGNAVAAGGVVTYPVPITPSASARFFRVR